MFLIYRKLSSGLTFLDDQMVEPTDSVFFVFFFFSFVPTKECCNADTHFIFFVLLVVFSFLLNKNFYLFLDELQDTTAAAVLSAALASKTSEPSTSGVSTTAPSDEGSSNVSIQSPSTNKHNKSLEAKINVRSDKEKEETSDTHTVEVHMNFNQDPHLLCYLASMYMSSYLVFCFLFFFSFFSSHDQDNGGEFGDTPSSRSFQADDVGFSSTGKSSVSTEAGKELQHPTMVDLDNTAADEQPSRAIDGSHSHEKANDSDLLVSDGGLKSPSTEADQTVLDSKGEVVNDKTAVAFDKLSDVHLNIRMPHGPNLQEKFSVTSTLRMVKEYIDEHQESVIGSYDLAIPYPRKVYSDQGQY